MDIVQVHLAVVQPFAQRAAVAGLSISSTFPTCRAIGLRAGAFIVHIVHAAAADVEALNIDAQLSSST